MYINKDELRKYKNKLFKKKKAIYIKLDRIEQKNKTCNITLKLYAFGGLEI